MSARPCSVAANNSQFSRFANLIAASTVYLRKVISDCEWGGVLPWCLAAPVLPIPWYRCRDRRAMEAHGEARVQQLWQPPLPGLPLRY